LGAKKSWVDGIWYNKKKRIPKPEIRPDFENTRYGKILEIVELSRSGPESYLKARAPLAALSCKFRLHLPQSLDPLFNGRMRR